MNESLLLEEGSGEANLKGERRRERRKKPARDWDPIESERVRVRGREEA